MKNTIMYNQSFKKMVSLLIVLCLVLSFVPLVNASIPLPAKIEVKDASGNPGDTVAVAVYMKPGPDNDFWAYDMNLQFDPTILELTGANPVQDELGSGDFEAVESSMSASVYQIAVKAKLFEDIAVSTKKQVLTLYFKIKANASPGATYVNVASAHYVTNTEPESTTDLHGGTVTITAPTPEPTPPPTATVTIGEASKKLGQTVEVPVTLTNANYGVGSYGMIIGFDKNVLEVAQINSASGDDFSSYYVNADGWLKVGWADASGGDHSIEAQDELFTITFHIKDTAALGDSPLTVDTQNVSDFTFTDADAVEMGKTLVNGKVTVLDLDTALTPTFSIAAGIYDSAQAVVLSSETAGAAIYYTTDGSTPTTASSLYAAPINVGVNQTIKAVAVKSGMHHSPTASADYEIKVPQPVLSPSGGTFHNVQAVELSSTEPGAAIYYTTNGSEPSTESNLYEAPILVSTDTIIKAVAVKDGMHASAVTSGAFVMQAATPTFNPAAGNYTSTQKVELSSITEGAAIYYTIDGSTPTTESPLYEAKINVSGSLTIKAIAVRAGMADSEAASAAYTINPPSTSTATPAPTATPPAKVLLKVDVVDPNGKAGGIVSSAEIERTLKPDGTKQDLINFTPAQAKIMVDSILTAGSKSAIIVIPDTNDEVSEVDVKISKETKKLISDAKLGLGINTDNVKVFIPDESLQGFTDDLFFHFVPIKDEVLKQEVKDRANKDAIVKVVAGDKEARVVGRPMTIETNMQNRNVTLVMPLNDVNLTEAELNDLGIYIEHSDGTKELIRGVLVPFNSKGELGLQFTVNKFSTFTLVDIDGLGAASRHLAYIKGYADGTFGPEKSITRAEMATILSRISTKAAITADITYSDVSSKHWAKAAISRVTAMGLMHGYPNGQFAPEKAVTRAEMASLVALLTGSSNQSAGAGFSDVSGNWALAAILQNQGAGLIKGYDDGTFKPGNPISRAEVVVIINKVLGRIEPMNTLENQYWKDVADTYWALKDINEASIDHAEKK